MNSGKQIIGSSGNPAILEKKLASIYKRGPNQWQALIRRKGFSTQARVFNTKAEAESWAQVTGSEMTRGVFVSRKEAENTTLSEALGQIRGSSEERMPAETRGTDGLVHIDEVAG